MSCKPLLLIAAVVACLSVAQPASADLIVNGGFETGDYTGWTTVAVNYPYFLIATSPAFVHSGRHAAEFAGETGGGGNVLTSDNTLSQTVATTVGQQYTLSFYLLSDGATPNNFEATWDTTVLFPFTTDIPAHPYQQYSYTVTGTGSDTVEFYALDNPGYFYLDDVSLNSAVPEPTGVVALLGLCGMGLLGMVWRCRRRAA
jgi:hypothetical protein